MSPDVLPEAGKRALVQRWCKARIKNIAIARKLSLVGMVVAASPVTSAGVSLQLCSLVRERGLPGRRRSGWAYTRRIVVLEDGDIVGETGQEGQAP